MPLADEVAGPPIQRQRPFQAILRLAGLAGLAIDLRATEQGVRLAGPIGRLSKQETRLIIGAAGFVVLGQLGAALGVI